MRGHTSYTPSWLVNRLRDITGDIIGYWHCHFSMFWTWVLSGNQTWFAGKSTIEFGVPLESLRKKKATACDRHVWWPERINQYSMNISCENSPCSIPTKPPFLLVCTGISFRSHHYHQYSMKSMKPSLKHHFLKRLLDICGVSIKGGIPKWMVYIHKGKSH